MTVLKNYLLSEWFQFGFSKFGKYEGTWREYLYMPIWGCQYCFAGQLSLWCFFFTIEGYHVFYHVAFIAVSILFTKIIYDRTKDY